MLTDRTYFGAINEEMDVDGEAAGIAAMLYELRRLPIDLNLVRKAPETVGLHAQRIASLRGPAKWLFDVLVRGYVGEYPGDSWREHYTTEELFGSYQQWAIETREEYAADRYAIGQFLKSMFKPYRPRAADGDRPPSYRLGTLTQARSIFAEKQGLGDPWPKDDKPEIAR